MSDTEASAPLRTPPVTVTNSRVLSPLRAERLKGWFKLAIVLITITLVLVNLWSSLRKGEDIREVSAATLAGLAKVAALEEARTQWQNTTATIQ
jgi:hypothetical protein